MNQHEYYEGIAEWVMSLLKQKVSKTPPLILGINGPQGAGKTTLARNLISILNRFGINAVSISIDDFYLTRAEQIKLAQSFPDNPYLQHRGYPGTHDLQLGIETLNQLKNIQTLKEVKLPRYDKSKNEGRGDRLSQSHWPTVQPPLDVVMFDGWMLGFQPIQSTLISNPHLRLINSNLKKYEAWINLMDAFLFLNPEDTHNIINWRVEAEENMKKGGHIGMSTEEVTDYIKTFIPAYELYLPQLRQDHAFKPHSLQITIQKDRLPDAKSQRLLKTLSSQRQ